MAKIYTVRVAVGCNTVEDNSELVGRYETEEASVAACLDWNGEQPWPEGEPWQENGQDEQGFRIYKGRKHLRHFRTAEYAAELLKEQEEAAA